MEYRTLGKTDVRISVVAMGCWPIAGMTSPGATDENSLATIRACLDLGINHLDTAYMYGAEGQSEKLIRKALGPRRDKIVLATKGGLHWTNQGRRVTDGRPETLRRQCDASLMRLGTDHVELYYLHTPDPDVPVAESAGAIGRLIEQGKVLCAGASNCDVAQLEAFAAECPLTAYQPLYNMLQREIEANTLPWCVEHGVSVLVYWPLLKGLLAGGLRRDSVLAETDSRRNYPMFHGQEWEKNHDFVDRLREIAAASGHSVAQLVINWTIRQPGITCALCGAKRPDQIRDTAGAADWRLSDDQLAQIDQALAERGMPRAETPI